MVAQEDGGCKNNHEQLTDGSLEVLGLVELEPGWLLCSELSRLGFGMQDDPGAARSLGAASELAPGPHLLGSWVDLRRILCSAPT